MRPKTKTILIGIVIIVVVVAFVAMIGVYRNRGTMKTSYELQQISREKQKKQEKQEKLYKDDGLGIMTISKRDYKSLREGYAQWKKDYPERARRIITSDTHGIDTVGLVLFYKTMNM